MSTTSNQCEYECDTSEHSYHSYTTSHSNDKSVYMNTALNQCEYERDTSEHSYQTRECLHEYDFEPV